jgi:acyl-coenzyme A synthetase/AMP-(fatty) acid ligase
LFGDKEKKFSNIDARALMKFGEAFSDKYDLSSLKILGTVGEPINPEAWLWYHKFVGHEKAAIVDTYWQVSCSLKLEPSLSIFS